MAIVREESVSKILCLEVFVAHPKATRIKRSALFISPVDPRLPLARPSPAMNPITAMEDLLNSWSLARRRGRTRASFSVQCSEGSVFKEGRLRDGKSRRVGEEVVLQPLVLLVLCFVLAVFLVL